MSFGGMLTGGDEEAKEAPKTEAVKESKAKEMKKKELANNTKEIIE